MSAQLCADSATKDGDPVASAIRVLVAARTALAAIATMTVMVLSWTGAGAASATAAPGRSVGSSPTASTQVEMAASCARSEFGDCLGSERFTRS